MPHRTLSQELIKLNKNVHYDIYKEKDICQKISKFTDGKVSKNPITDKDKTDLSNDNDINGTPYKHKSTKLASEGKKITQKKRKCLCLVTA